jgi:hypothetical protein
MRVLLAIIAGMGLLVCPIGAQTGSSAPTASRPQASATQPQASPGVHVPVPAADLPKAESACSGRSAKECGVSREVFRKAEDAFRKAQKLKESAPDEALAAFEEAARLVPRDLAYARAREMFRQQLVYNHIQRGNELALQGRSAESIAEFRQALELDPGNEFAVQRLRDLVHDPATMPAVFIEPSAEEQEIAVQPKPGQQLLHLTGDTRGAYSQAAAAFGIKASFDDSTPVRAVRLELDKVTFAQAMDALSLVTHTFWTPVGSKEILVAADTREKHKELDRWVARSFYLSEVTTPQELNDIVTLMRTVFELRMVVPAPADSAITVRGPAAVVQAATQLLQTLWPGRAQVMLDVEVCEVTAQMLRNLGVSLPLQLDLFYIPGSVITALQSSNFQQLLSTTGASGSSLSALLTQAGLSQYAALLQNPIATFGGGSSIGGVGIPPGSVNFSANNSRVISLDKVDMLASQGNAATFRFGSRYPVMNASYSAFVNLPPQVASAVGLSSTSTANSLATYPSFSYEDLGITVKAKPSIHGTSEVTLDLEMELRALGSEVYNGVPTIMNRSYKGVITVKNDFPAVIAGSLSRTEQDSLTGIPGLGSLPLLGPLTNNRTHEHDEDELLVLITPHIVRTGPTHHGPAIVVPRTQN